MVSASQYRSLYGAYDCNREKLSAKTLRAILEAHKVTIPKGSLKFELAVMVEKLVAKRLVSNNNFPDDYLYPTGRPKIISTFKLILTAHDVPYPEEASLASVSGLYDEHLDKFRAQRAYKAPLSKDDEDDLCGDMSRMDVDEEPEREAKKTRKAGKGKKNATVFGSTSSAAPAAKSSRRSKSSKKGNEDTTDAPRKSRGSKDGSKKKRSEKVSQESGNVFSTPKKAKSQKSTTPVSGKAMKGMELSVASALSAASLGHTDEGIKSLKSTIRMMLKQQEQQKSGGPSTRSKTRRDREAAEEEDEEEEESGSDSDDESEDEDDDESGSEDDYSGEESD